jgi:hypothetical protein
VKEQCNNPRELTLAIYEALDAFLGNPAVLRQSTAQKEMRNRIKPLLSEYGVNRALSKTIVEKLVEA